MTKIKIVGGLIFIVAIVLAALFNHISQQNRINSGLLNVVNEQKAFTQEISKNIFYINKNRDASTAQLDDSIKQFIERMKNKNAILDEIDSPEIKEKSREILVLWNEFYLSVQEFRDKSKTTVAYSNIILEEIVKDVYTINLKLVVEFNNLIELHQAHLDETLETYKNIQYTLFVVLVLLLIYLFTQLQTIIAFVQKFLHTSTKIITDSSVTAVEPFEVNGNSDDITQASGNFNQLLGQINNAVNHASSSIEHSSQSLDAIEAKIEDLLELMCVMQEDDAIDKELTKKEDALIQSLEELSSSAQKLKALKSDLDELIHHKNITKND